MPNQPVYLYYTYYYYIPYTYSTVIYIFGKEQSLTNMHEHTIRKISYFISYFVLLYIFRSLS